MVYMIPHLGNRLQKIADFVEGPVAADIGCDHGYLSIWLALSCKALKVYAVDINRAPLEKAARNAARWSVPPEIMAMGISDGLCAFGPGGEFSDVVPDDIIISGMGGELIWRIIGASETALHSRLILSPNTRADELRRMLYTNGFSIEKESAVYENRRFYPVMLAVYTGGEVPHCLADIYIGKSGDNAYSAYIYERLKRTIVRYEKMKTPKFEADITREFGSVENLRHLIAEITPNKSDTNRLKNREQIDYGQK